MAIESRSAASQAADKERSDMNSNGKTLSVLAREGIGGGATTQTAEAGWTSDGSLTGRVLSVPRIVLLSPFKALRRLYWLVDRDARIRSQGLQTAGVVVATNTETRVFTDS
jgi:hypothetical protein